MGKKNCKEGKYEKENEERNIWIESFFKIERKKKRIEEEKKEEKKKKN